jgi:hypothetical protein
MVRVDHLPALPSPGQLQDVVVTVESSEEERQVDVVFEQETFFLVGQLPQIYESPSSSRNGVPDLLVDKFLLRPKRVMAS